MVQAKHRFQNKFAVIGGTRIASLSIQMKLHWRNTVIGIHRMPYWKPLSTQKGYVKNICKTAISGFWNGFLFSPKIRLCEKGYQGRFFCSFFFIGTDSPTINVNRVGQRVAEGGHSVPLQKIFSRYTKSLANLAPILQVVHRGYIYDNSIDDEIPKLQFRTELGTLKKIYQTEHEWAEQIRKCFQGS